MSPFFTVFFYMRASLTLCFPEHTFVRPHRGSLEELCNCSRLAWSMWTTPEVSDTMILFTFPPNFAHLLAHLLRTAHLDNFELNATQSILKSDLQAPRSFFLTLPTRISQIFGSLPLLSLVLVESVMRNGDFMMYHEQRQRIIDIFT